MQCDASNQCCIKWSAHWAPYYELKIKLGGQNILPQRKASAGRLALAPAVATPFHPHFPQQKIISFLPLASSNAKPTHIYKCIFSCYDVHFSLYTLNLHPTGLIPKPSTFFPWTSCHEPMPFVTLGKNKTEKRSHGSAHRFRLLSEE